MTLFVNYWTLSSFAILIITTPHWWQLPGWFWSVPCLVWLLLCIKFRWLRWGCGLIAALLVVIVSGNLLRHQTNTLFNASLDLTINAEVDSLFKPINHGFHGIVVIRSINGNKIDYFSRPRVYLTAPHHLKLGENVTARVKLKPVIGVLNRVGFDKEKYVVSQRVVGQVSIGSKASIIIESTTSWRQTLFAKAIELTNGLEHRGLLLALTFGERAYVDKNQWLRLQQSGLSHLVAISGLHIGIAFGFGWLVGFQFIRFGVTSLWVPTIASMLFAWSYAWLSGFSLPTERAVILLTIFVCLRLLNIAASNRYKWLLMLAGLLLYDPFSVYSNSFWLSVCAVAIVFLMLSLRLGQGSKFKQALLIQFGLVLLMSPVIALIFHGVSLGSFIYNILFVPWFSLFVIPLLLATMAISAIAPQVAAPLYSLADLSLIPVISATNLSHFSWLPVSMYTASCILFITVFSLMRAFFDSRFIAVALLLTILGIAARRDDFDWRLDVLDVGHGLAVVIESNQRAIVYDTGASWEHGSYAKSVIVPYLHSRGLTLDTIIISHFDNDHAGGLRDLLQSWPLAKVISSQVFHEKNAQSIFCIKGDSWYWQQLTFEVLWPPKAVTRAYNPHSCVIRIMDNVNRHSVLLTGDVEGVAEWLLLREPNLLKNDVILVPHHGSRSSSLPDFVEAVDANVAIASTAYQGRWTLPHPKVKQRYIDLGAQWLETGAEGQTSLFYQGQNLRIVTMRIAKGRAWYRQMLRKRVE
ncbi:DNA internalization-related competence protein ComEC/Rec2 [Vibrio kasasachensis]|uniref:DNA internalization-related competence protein ComEC/Rec2 n=1 Tax=Vibrio kasasachensis TaxID=2910248 RepID=UPI003D100A06